MASRMFVIQGRSLSVYHPRCSKSNGKLFKGSIKIFQVFSITFLVILDLVVLVLVLVVVFVLVRQGQGLTYSVHSNMLEGKDKILLCSNEDLQVKDKILQQHPRGLQVQGKEASKMFERH